MFPKFIAALLIPICLALATRAAVWGWADLAVSGPRHTMHEWQSAKTGPNDDKEWTRIVERIEAAHAANPYAATYSADLGRIYEWRAVDLPLWSKEAYAYRETAISHYREAAELSPSWGFAWAHLAQVKVLNRQLDQEMLHALEKAMVFSPWEPGTQRKVIHIGIALWKHLPTPLHDQLIRSVQRALQENNAPTSIISLAQGYGWLDHLRPLLIQDRHKKLLKRILAKTRK